MHRFTSRSIPARVAKQVREYNFASAAYAGCFGNLPHFDPTPLRIEAVKYIEAFDAKTWYEDPISTVLNGTILSEGTKVVTLNAFNEENGEMVHATASVVDSVISHMQTFSPPKTDLRTELRAIEQELLTKYAATLVGNQAVDFKKQDGITEIEESVEANTVERRLNDLLLSDEIAGKVTIHRNPALVGCVSNFSNFLDLFRKTIRNLELGVPVVVLSRSNTAQHTYRWFQVLNSLLAKYNVDPGMLTHASCDIEQQRRIISANPDSPLYFTGSRPVSEAIKEICPKLMSSTGGPNTMVTDVWTESISEAARMSAAIENSGQCTALRHLVAPNLSPTQIEKTFGGQMIEDSKEALSIGEFAGLFKHQPTFSVEPGYSKHPDLPMAYRVNQALPESLDEKWRQYYVDVTNFASEQIREPAVAHQLSQWLVAEQPISLATNSSTFPEAFALMAPLFEQTCMVVYTVGCDEKAALTAQARPQDAEIFGEFCPRAKQSNYTKFPVIGPSSTPGYDTTYTASYLAASAEEASPDGMAYIDEFIGQVSSESIRGYLRVLLQYLSEAAQGPRRGFGQRTALWGLQRPPLGTMSVIRCDASTSFDDLSVNLLPFLVTNARGQVQVSVDPGNAAVLQGLSNANMAISIVRESDSDFATRSADNAFWNVVKPSTCQFDLVSHHVSLLFPLGHIKCTRSNDQEFVDYFTPSPKWLHIVNQS
jgi:hypothetical protein